MSTETTYTVESGRLLVKARATLHTAQVAFPRFAGAFTVTDDDAGVPTAIAGEVRASFETMEGGDVLLRREARKALDPGRWPEATLALQTVRAAPGSLGELHGELRYRDRSAPLTVSVHGSRSEERLTARARFDLDVSRFGLKPPRLLFLKVDEIVECEVELSARPG